MNARRSQLDGLAIVLLLACCLLWGLNQVATKLALAGIPPLQQAGLRSLAAAVLVAAWSVGRGVSLSPRNGTLAGGLLAGALFAAEFGCIFIGLQHTTASRMVVLLYTSPLVVALGMPFIQKSERLRAPQWAGLGLAFGCVALAVLEGRPGAAGEFSTWRGDLLGLAAALLWGATTLVVRGSRLASASPEQTLFYQLAVSGVLLLAAARGVGEAPAWPQHWSAAIWGLMAFQTVVISFASYLVWFWLVRHYPATRVASFTLLTPLAGVLAGVLLLGEPWGWRLVLACLGVVAGIALVQRGGRPK